MTNISFIQTSSPIKLIFPSTSPEVKHLKVITRAIYMTKQSNAESF